MTGKEDLRQAEKVFMEDLLRQHGAFEARGDTFMYAGHVAGDMIIIGGLPTEAALDLLKQRRNSRRCSGS